MGGTRRKGGVSFSPIMQQYGLNLRVNIRLCLANGKKSLFTLSHIFNLNGIFSVIMRIYVCKGRNKGSMKVDE